MAKARGDFTDILVRQQILSPDQLDEAKGLQQATGAKLQDALVKLDYATMEQIMTAIAEFHGMQFVDLTDVTIPPPSSNWCPNRSPAKTSSCRSPRTTARSRSS